MVGLYDAVLMELHTYYIGASGMGKSTLLLHHCIARLQQGHGVFVLDPHGDLIDTLVPYIPKRRRKDTILFDPTRYCLGINPVHQSDNPSLAADTMLYALKDVWRFHGLSTPTFDDTIYHTLLTLLQSHNTTLLGSKYLLTNAHYRQKLTDNLSDIALRHWWEDYEAMSSKERRDETRSSRNKLSLFLTDPRLLRTFGQIRPSFTMSDVLDGRVLLCRLPQGQLGLDKARLIGMLLLAQFHLAALDRTDRSPFHVYIDEMSYFQGHALMEMLSGVRKYGVSLHLAHQYLDQLTRDMQSSIIGNITERYIFNVSRADTEKLEIEDGHDNTKYAFYELPRYVAMHQGQEVRVSPLPEPPHGQEAAVTSSRRYARSQKKVDREIQHFFSSL